MSKYCNACGYELKDDQLYCPSCGAKSEVAELENPTVTPENPNISATKAGVESSNIGTPMQNKTFPKVPFIIGSVVTVFVISAIIIAYILWFDNSYNTPLESYTKGINNGDARMIQKAFTPTIAYGEYYFENVAKLSNKLDGITVKVSVEDKTHLKISEINDILKEDGYNSYIPKTMAIQDCYMVILVVTTKEDGKTQVDTYNHVPLVKLEGDWYIADSTLLYILN